MGLVKKLAKRLRERIPDNLRKADRMLEEELSKIGNFERRYEPPSRNNNRNLITYSDTRLQVYLHNPLRDDYSSIERNDTYNFGFKIANSCKGREEEGIYHSILSVLREAYQLNHFGVTLRQKPSSDYEKSISEETLIGTVNLLSEIVRDFYLLVKDKEVLSIAKEYDRNNQEACRRIRELKEESDSLRVVLESQRAETLKRIKQIRSIRRLQVR